MFVDAVADQSLVIQGYLNSVACTKSFLHYIFPPRPGATFNFIKKLVKVTLSLCLSPACLSVWTCFFSKALWGLCSCSSTSACLAIGAVPGDRRAAILQRDSRDTGIWLEGHSLLWTGHWVNAGGAKGKKKIKKTLRSHWDQAATAVLAPQTHTDTHPKRHRHGDTERHPEAHMAQKTHQGPARHVQTPTQVMVTKRPWHMGMSDSCSQHHSVTEGNCHFCVYPKCLHPPFLIHGMFVLIGQEENLLALKLPIFSLSSPL